MNRSDLVDVLAGQFEQWPRRDIDAVVRTILDATAHALAHGHRVEIRGFGTFSIHYRAPRIGRNPRTGEPVQVAEQRLPHFKPGKQLRELVDTKP